MLTPEDQIAFFNGLMAGWPGMARDEDRLMMESILKVLKRQCGPNGKAWEKVWISQDVIMHLQGIEAQAGKLSDAINLFKRFESEARTDATGTPQEKA